MINEKYIIAYKNFVSEELRLIAEHQGKEFAKRMTPYYTKMYEYILNNPNEFICFKESDVKYFEMEFAETVVSIRERLIELANQSNIPTQILFIPKVKIENNFWDNIISVKVVQIIRQLFDCEKGENYETLRKYNAFERYCPIQKWISSKNGKNFLFEFQVSQGIRSEILIKKRLYLFDNEFVRQQMMWMSEMIWIHVEVVNAFEKWKNDKTLWNNIDYVKRKITSKEILDESRPEIKFLRLLEKIGLKNKFIHDEQISWQLKFRPDFWFINENLIVEYDEKAHKFQQDDDKLRESIIKKYIPNIHFIRVNEGFEEQGIRDIMNYLNKFN